MAYKRFEELPVWQAAIELAVKIFEFTAAGGVSGKAGFRDQIERAVVSISNNIAEGWERGTYEELLTFLYIARGSAGEVRSMLLLHSKIGSPEELDGLIERSLDVSRQLGGWLESLKNSSDKGPRYRTAATQRAQDDKRRRSEFLEKLRQIQEEAKSSREQSSISIRTDPGDPLPE